MVMLKPLLLRAVHVSIMPIEPEIASHSNTQDQDTLLLCCHTCHFLGVMSWTFGYISRRMLEHRKHTTVNKPGFDIVPTHR